MSKIASGFLTGLLLVFLPGPGQGQEEKELKPLLDKILNAYGGEQKLSQIKAVSFTRKTTVTKDGKMSIQKLTIQLTQQLHSETEQEENGKKFKQIYIRVGNKAWIVKDGKVEEKMYTDEQGDNFTRFLKYQMGLFSLLLKEPDLKLELLGDVKVANAETVRLKVTNPKTTKFPSRTYFFDKKTGLLAKREMTLKDKEGKEFLFEMSYHDYKKMDGVAVAHKTISKKDGDVIVEQLLSDFRVLEKVDPKLFLKPEVTP